MDFDWLRFLRFGIIFYWLEVGGYDETLKTNGEDINFCKKLSENKLVTFYDSATFCYHLQEDDLSSLSKRYWRYKTFGYKIKKFTLLKFIKISIKEIKMLFRRIFSNIKKKDYNLLSLEMKIFIRFIYFELKETLKR